MSILVQRVRQVGRVATTVVLAAAAGACSLDSLLKNDEIPPGTTDPAITKTPQGALAAYHGTVAKFQQAFGGHNGQSFIDMSGLLGDELRTGSLLGSQLDIVDLRSVPESPTATGGISAFKELQQVRGQAGQTIGLFTDYAPEQRALVGHTYALEAYAEVMLAELFCSGIPLSTLDYNGDYTLKPGSTTAQVLTHAIALFDTALTLATDTTRFIQLAKMGKGRALLGLGDYVAAATAVADVPDDFRYEFTFAAVTEAARSFVYSPTGLWEFSVADEEGLNGLDYISSGDPRTAGTLEGKNIDGYAVYQPNKYAADGSGPIPLATGLEARLIEAEAALQASGDWLGKLNALRTDGTFDTQPNAADPSKTDTLWHAGTGGMPGLAPLADPDPSPPPGSTTPRVNLLFRERAFWLFLTGHRQGDMRRLIRQYGRAEDQVYPIGSYPAPSGFTYQYGNNVTLPAPPDERESNPLYTGCFSRGA